MKGWHVYIDDRKGGGFIARRGSYPGFSDYGQPGQPSILKYPVLSGDTWYSIQRGKVLENGVAIHPSALPGPVARLYAAVGV